MPGVASELRKDHERIVARRDKVRLLIGEGRSHTDIAAIIGVSARTVDRDRAVLGMADSRADQFAWNQHSEWLARNLIADECPIAEIARSIGASDHHVVRNHFRGEIPPGYIGGDPLVSHRQMARDLGLLMRPRRVGRYPDQHGKRT